MPIYSDRVREALRVARLAAQHDVEFAAFLYDPRGIEEYSRVVIAAIDYAESVGQDASAADRAVQSMRILASRQYRFAARSPYESIVNDALTAAALALGAPGAPNSEMLERAECAAIDAIAGARANGLDVARV